MSIDVIDMVSKYNNICKYIHFTVQSGSDKILKLMKRGYNRSEYIKLIDDIKEYLTVLFPWI